MDKASMSTICEAIEPDLPIVDAHHHLWAHSDGHYLPFDQWRADLAAGHNVVASVYIECGAMYRTEGPQALRPVGEAEFVAGLAATGVGGLDPARICTAFVGGADLTLGDAVDDVLEALAVASGGRLRGIRGTANWNADPSVNTGTRPFAPRSLLLDSRFRSGFARLAARRLAYDAWQYHPQLPELGDLADAFPDTTIIANHCGGLVGIGPYARPDNFARWRAFVADVARRPNVHMKLGGLGGRRCGFAYDTRSQPATADELAELWKPYIETCIELFGPTRCMFESNYPPDRAAGRYVTIWNAFKLITAGCSAAEKHNLFSATARRVYQID
jgi:predicted TIM-barrel fold metal-dependent hydrolase